MITLFTGISDAAMALLKPMTRFSTSAKRTTAAAISEGLNDKNL
jgi:hypothetical protein